jgi:heat shock protein beta
MTKKDLITHLGTIAKSGTSEFLAKVQENGESGVDTSNLIGQFGVGFYSAFLVADTVVVTTKHNDDVQYIWTSNAAEYSIVEDPRPDEDLKRGTRISLYLKEEAQDFLDNETIRGLVKKYSEFINWDIYLYTSKTVEEEAEEEEEEVEKKDEKSEDDKVEDEEAKVEEAPSEKKKVTKTVWDWEVINANKPIWNRKTSEVTDEEYAKFYKAFSKDVKVLHSCCLISYNPGSLGSHPLYRRG